MTIELNHLKPEHTEYLPKLRETPEYEKMTVTVTAVKSEVCDVEVERGRRLKGKFLSWMTGTTRNGVKEIVRTKACYTADGKETAFYFYDYEGIVNAGDSVTLLFVKTSACNVQQFIGLGNNTTGESASFLNKECIREVIEHADQKVWNIGIRLQQLLAVAIVAIVGWDLYTAQLTPEGATRLWEGYYMYFVPFFCVLMWLWNGYGHHMLLHPLREIKTIRVRYALFNIVKAEVGSNIAAHRLAYQGQHYHTRLLNGTVDQEPCHH
ncbi:hypothetical protein OTK49_21270 [Vibrio coralliirubri]|uniref:hypothetical protein n=1 Tax=Vibrio coralliirubri TaxID=1516159 RepID=UPI00228505FA|nr:hypothetical protein [Vibrio coralliirubri]MCY9865052.1 hypothetical protein [Vibrio coralliirubri]